MWDRETTGYFESWEENTGNCVHLRSGFIEFMMNYILMYAMIFSTFPAENIYFCTESFINGNICKSLKAVQEEF